MATKVMTTLWLALWFTTVMCIGRHFWNPIVQQSWNWETQNIGPVDPWVMMDRFMADGDVQGRVNVCFTPNEYEVYSIDGVNWAMRWDCKILRWKA